MAGAAERRHRRDLVELRDLRQRLGSVGDGVVAVGRNEAGEDRCGATARTDPGQHEARCEGDEDAQQHP